MKLKRIAGSAAVAIGRGSGLLAYFESRMRRGLTILTYHRVLPDDAIGEYPLPQLAVSASLFDAQMEVVAARCQVVSLEDGIRALAQGEIPARPMVAITFDDGYVDNLVIAGPVLARLGLTGMFFVVAGYIGGSQDLWFDRAARTRRPAEFASMSSWLNHLKSLGPADRDAILARLEDSGPARALAPFARIMNGQEVKQLMSAGHGVGCHTMTHPILTGLSDDELRSEIRDSRSKLEQVCDGLVSVFCYPGGARDARVTRAVEQTGFTAAVSTDLGCNLPGCDLLALKRRDAGVRRVRSGQGGLNRTAWRAELSGLNQALAGTGAVLGRRTKPGEAA